MCGTCRHRRSHPRPNRHAGRHKCIRRRMASTCRQLPAFVVNLVANFVESEFQSGFWFDKERSIKFTTMNPPLCSSPLRVLRALCTFALNVVSVQTSSSSPPSSFPHFHPFSFIIPHSSLPPTRTKPSTRQSPPPLRIPDTRDGLRPSRCGACPVSRFLPPQKSPNTSPASAWIKWKNSSKPSPPSARRENCRERKIWGIAGN